MITVQWLQSCPGTLSLATHGKGSKFPCSFFAFSFLINISPGKSINEEAGAAASHVLEESGWEVIEMDEDMSKCAAATLNNEVEKREET